MLTIDKYLCPASLAEAYEMAQMKNAVVLGGMMWLRLGSRRISTAIDLSSLHLDSIEDTGDSWRIGAYTTLRMLETHCELNQHFSGVFHSALSSIVGVQFRNLATAGGSVYGRFGFSDVITSLLAMDASVELYGKGSVPLKDFCTMPRESDILTHIILPREKVSAAYCVQRNTATDFPVLNVCAVHKNDTLTVAVGARPLMAVPFHFQLDSTIPLSEQAVAIAKEITEQVVIASNKRASEIYRRHLCNVLVRRAITEIAKQEGC